MRGAPCVHIFAARLFRPFTARVLHYASRMRWKPCISIGAPRGGAPKRCTAASAHSDFVVTPRFIRIISHFIIGVDALPLLTCTPRHRPSGCQIKCAADQPFLDHAQTLAYSSSIVH
eukprot:IDg18210t1